MERPERLAVNLFDLDRVDPQIRGMFISDKLDLSAIITVDANKPDERALCFSCDLLTAAAVCDVLRNNDRKLGDVPIRIYMKAGDGRVWMKLGAGVVFTHSDGPTDGNGLSLNPTLFPPLHVMDEEAPDLGAVDMRRE